MKLGSAIQGPHPKLQRFWDVRAAANFIGGGVGTGLIITAAVVAFLGGEWRLELLFGLGFVAFGLGMVFLEIGRPWRAINVFFHPRTSWMTREGVMALPLGIGGIVALASTVFARPELVTPALVITAICAAAFVYCQANILRAARGVPAWRQPALLPIMLVTALTEGVGVFAVIGVFHLSGRMLGGMGTALILLVVGRSFLWARYRSVLRSRGAPTSSLNAIDALNGPFQVVGHVLPALLAAVDVLWSAGGWLLALAGLLAAVSGWYAKLTIITKAAATNGFAIPQTPKRGRGTSRVGARPGWGGS